MRQIGTISDRDQADRFADFLRGQGVACSVDTGDAGWSIWIHDEDRVSSAKAELQTFLADPAHERYRDAHRQADEKFREDYQRKKAARKQTVSVRGQWDRPLGERCPVTMGLLLVCAVVGFFTRLGGQFVMPGEQPVDFLPLIRELWISPDGTWRAIFAGQVWRIWTPIFLHYGWLHLIFNGFWLRDFGMLLEDRLGTLRFFILVLIVGAAGNIAEFAITGNPQFGGMSGVNYGLFGYLWVRGKLDPASGLGVSQQTALWMGVWFLVCWSGLVGNIANWDHGAGLAAGAGLGALAAIRRR